MRNQLCYVKYYYVIIEADQNILMDVFKINFKIETVTANN